MESILGNTRKADITFYSSGRIDISARVAKMLKLHKGDVVDILAGELEYYMYVKHRAPVVGRHDATVYKTNKNGENYRTNSRKLCRAVLDKCGAEERAKICAGEPKVLTYGMAVPIITKLMLI